MGNDSEKNCIENQNTYFTFNNVFFEHRAVYEIVWKNIVERGRPQMTIQCLLDTEVFKHTLRICNMYCFSTATMVARTRFIVTL